MDPAILLRLLHDVQHRSILLEDQLREAHTRIEQLTEELSNHGEDVEGR